MNMFHVDRLMYALLVLVCLSVVGMLLSSWRVILYPYFIAIGIAILIGMLKQVKKNPVSMWVPVSVTVIYLLLYGFLDLITLDSPGGGNGYVLGMKPSMALYLLGMWPFAVVVSLLYAWSYSREEPLRYEKSPEIDMKG